MAVVISMLRGINVGGHNKIKMDALRALYASLGLENPQSHIQSGNIIFGSKEKKLAALAARITEGIEKTFAMRPEVILRTLDEMRSTIERNPFAGREEVPPNKLVVIFLARDPDSQAQENLRKLPSTPEELHLSGRELYIYFPDGMGKSKLPVSAIDKALKVPGTARNWNTVTKLLELAEKWER